MRFFASREKGFNLMEVIFVITLLSIFASVVFVNVGEARKKARDAQRVSDIQQIQLALRVYRDANNSAYPTSATGEKIVYTSGVGQTLSSYLTGTVVDPLNTTSGYGYYYSTNYDCTAAGQTVLVVLQMERSGNFDIVCGSTAHPNIVAGVPTTVKSYIVILK